MEKLKRYDLNCNIFDVYDYDGLSMQELLCQFYTKINECVDLSNSTLDLAEWLVNEGLKQEIALKLTNWLNDGTLENIINESLFENLNKKIDNVCSQLEQNANVVKEHTQRLDNIFNIDIQLLGAKMNGEDESSILQSAIDTLYLLGGGNILIPKGTLLVNETINLKSNVNIVGTGHNSIIKTTNGYSSWGMNVLQGVSQSNISIQNIKIEGTGFGKSGEWLPKGSLDGAGSCIVFADCNNILIENCWLYNGGGENGGDGVGNIWLSCCQNSRVVNNIVSKGDNGICVDRWFSNFNTDGVDRSGIFNNGVIVSNNNIYDMTGRALAIENKNKKGSIIINANTFTSCAYAFIDGRDLTNCIISNNTFEGSLHLLTRDVDVSECVRGIYILNGCNDVIISNNNMQNLGLGMQLLNSTDFNIIGNSIRNITNESGIIIKNADYDLNLGSISNNVINGGKYGIHIYKDRNDSSTLKNISVTNNVINFRESGIKIEHINFSIINSNLIYPLTSYNGSSGIIGNNLTRCTIRSNQISSCTVGLNIDVDNSSDTSNRFDTCSTSIYLTSATKTILRDIVRGGNVGVNGISGNSNVNVDGVLFQDVKQQKVGDIL